MKQFFIKHKLLFMHIGLALAITAMVFGLWVIVKTQQAQTKPTSQATKQAGPPQAPLDPLQIEAIKARDYTGSIIKVEQSIGAIGGQPTQIVSYNSDGFKVFALLTTPAGTPPAGGWPTVILNHGYINPAIYRTNDGSYTGITAALARAGIAVIKPDYRGHGQSEGQPSGGHFSPVYTYDNMNLIASIARSPALNLNAKRLGTLGHSLGAHTSLRVAVVNPNIKATAYLSGVVASIYDILYNWPRSPMPGDLPRAVQTNRQTLLDKYGTPEANPSFWDSVSAINYVGGITGPSQIHHSTGDSNVPVSFSAKLNDALVAADKPVEYFVYPGDDHQLSASGNAALLYSRIVQLFTSSL